MDQTQPMSIDPATEIGWTALIVGDMQRSLQFYLEVLGFSIMEQRQQTAVLGAGSGPLLVLVEQPGAQPKPARATGLYHFAILVPDRGDLARSLRQLATTRYGLDGYADHLVSEALYLADPDGNGIEIYRDRPRNTWQWSDGMVRMATDPIDLAGLLAEAEQDGRPWDGLPSGTRIGHVHFQVADLGQAEAFYHGVLGFDIVSHFPGALFVSAGGYHHHLGLNTWRSRNAPPPPPNAAGLRAFAIVAPTEAAWEQVATRLQAAAVPHTMHAHGITFDDPWRNAIVVTSRANLASAVALVTDGV